MRHERIVCGVDLVAFCGGFGRSDIMRLTIGGLRGTPLSGVPTGTQFPCIWYVSCYARAAVRGQMYFARLRALCARRTPARLIAGNWYQNDPLSVFRASRREAKKANGKLFFKKNK